MIWKRIEIVFRLGSAVALWALMPAAAEARAAQAFPVVVAADAPPQRLAPLPGVSGQAPDLPAEPVPDIPYSFFWTAADGLSWRARDHARRAAVSEHSPGLLGGFALTPVETPATRWQPRPRSGGWSAGAARWNTQLDDSTSLTLGSSEIGVPEWNDTLQLGGIRLSQSFLASSEDVAQWNYSLALGAVDQSATGANDLQFGPMAGSLALSYDYSPTLRLTTRTEVANDLFMSGVAGQYDLGWMGRWHSGVSRSTRGGQQGWRYRARADFDLDEDLSLAWMGERLTDGFMDVRRYAAGAHPVGSGRQRWSASWDSGAWGKWSGSFESVHPREGAPQRRFGLSRQFWYSPNLRVGIHAEREMVSDDYDIGLRFSFPLY